jgi:hypothetical protein
LLAFIPKILKISHKEHEGREDKEAATIGAWIQIPSNSGLPCIGGKTAELLTLFPKRGRVSYIPQIWGYI